MKRTLQDISAKPLLSVIIVVYNMSREAPKTLYSLCAAYQRDICADDYEVIVVDNGSATPLGEDMVASFGENFRYCYIDHAPASPAYAVNRGVALASGALVGIMVDGARMVTPGVLHYACQAYCMNQDAVVATLGWHLGLEPQTASIAKGYDAAAEDQLLDGIAWPSDGYRLFDISALAGSSQNGFFMPIAESNCFFLQKRHFDRLGGFDEAFDMPGGGLINGDFFSRACEEFSLVLLLGEGSFHQVHGGIATNASADELRERARGWLAHYQKLRHKAFAPVSRKPVFLGHMPTPVMRFIDYSVRRATGAD